jgi:hypothetical protein
MTIRDWSTIRHFKREEWVKDPDKISWDVVMLMDEMRDAINKPIQIHVAWDDKGHITESSHYADAREFATGVDFHVVGMPLVDQWLFVERYPWNGIGVYPFWNQPGLHVDLRKLGRDQPHLGKRWWRNKQGIYEAFSSEFLNILRAG